MNLKFAFGKKEFSEKLFDKYKTIGGIDECGIGCIAGPTMSSIVVVDENCLFIPEVTDSKKLSEKKREYLYDKIKENVLCYSSIMQEPKDIDNNGLFDCLEDSYKNLILKSKVQPKLTILDGTNIILRVPDYKIICENKADLNYYVVGCASIIAKVERDRLMKEYGDKYPNYLFEKHKGYCTAAHEEAVKKYGRISGFHRESYLFPFEKGNIRG